MPAQGPHGETRPRPFGIYTDEHDPAPRTLVKDRRSRATYLNLALLYHEPGGIRTENAHSVPINTSVNIRWLNHDPTKSPFELSS